MSNRNFNTMSVGQGKSTMQVNTDILRQATAVLNRYKAAFPFPVDRMELYRACMPTWVLEARNSAEVRQGLSVQDFNLLVSAPPNSTVHFRLCDREKDLSDDGQDVFWVDFEEYVAASGHAGLLVPIEYVNRIHDWVRAARDAEQEIFEAKQHVSAAAGEISTQAELKLLWPELAKVVHCRVADPGPGVRDVKRLRSRFAAAVGPIDMRSTSDTLAKCLLLPESYKVTAWPGRRWNTVMEASSAQ